MKATSVWGLVVAAGVFAPALVAGGALAECLPLCPAPSTTYAYVPPLIVVTSGDAVTWSSTDGQPHTASDPDAYCFNASYGAGTTGAASFRIADGVLYADSSREKACPTATFTPDGAAIIDYICIYHPVMKGALMVLPS